MPLEERPMSFSQFGELLGLEYERLRGVRVNRKHSTITVLLEPVDAASPDQRDVPAPDGPAAEEKVTR